LGIGKVKISGAAALGKPISSKQERNPKSIEVPATFEGPPVSGKLLRLETSKSK
jgi:hypothetical protein